MYMLCKQVSDPRFYCSKRIHALVCFCLWSEQRKQILDCNLSATFSIIAHAPGAIFNYTQWCSFVFLFCTRAALYSNAELQAQHPNTCFWTHHWNRTSTYIVFATKVLSSQIHYSRPKMIPMFPLSWKITEVWISKMRNATFKVFVSRNKLRFAVRWKVCILRLCLPLSYI